MSDDLEAKVCAAVELIEQLGVDPPRLTQLDEELRIGLVIAAVQ
jgi:hypothetical protein